jgi:UDP-N-acetylmuramate--alanine ligase
LNTVGAHGKLGEGEFIVAEADESDRSFLYLSPYIAVLTNLDEEHLDQYETVEEIKKTFTHFANKVPFYCPVILCLDDSNLKSLIPQLDRQIITYGFSAQADVFARNLQFHEFTSTSTLYWEGKEIGKLNLNVPGVHSIHNAMAAVAVGLYLDIPAATILEALEKYTGIGRRFELKKIVKNISIIEDYAHHPTEIKATLEAAKKGWTRRTIAIFQPHRYTRLSVLMDEFANSFKQADILFLTDIYPAGEKPIKGVTGKALYEEIQKIGQKNVYFEKDLGKIPDLVEKIAQPEDMIFVLGAGNINKIIPEIIERLERRK